MKRVLVAVLGIVVCVWTGRAQQLPPPVFRSGASLVQVDVAVLDSRRQPIAGLTANDFTLLEDGKPRPIEAFAAIDLPARETASDAAWTRDIATDVATNDVGAREGRIVVILMDRSIPVGQPVIAARRIAAAAVDALGPGDLAAVVSTGGNVPQNLTADRARLLKAIDQPDWSAGTTGDTGMAGADILAGTSVATAIDGVFSSLADPRCFCGLCVLETVTNVATSLEGMPRRRKSMLFIGSQMTIQAAPQVAQAEIGCGVKLKDAREKMFSALDRAGVTIHSIDPSGLQVLSTPASMAGSARGTGGGRGGGSGPRGGGAAEAAAANIADQGTLRILPDRTGGRMVANSNGPETIVPEIVRESQSYYVLGFTPSESAVPGESRAIEVKVNRRGVRVTARRNFVVPGAEGAAATAGSSASDALTATMPGGPVTLGMNVSAFAAPGKATGTVAIAIDVSGFAPAQAASGGSATAVVPLDVSVGAFTPAGQLRASGRQTMDVSWPADARARRVEALARLDLAPGDYEIRAAVTGGLGERPASVFSYITVPSFATLPLSLSNLIIAAAPGANVVPSGVLEPVLPVAPSTSRTFSRTEPAVAFLRIYQGTGRDAEIQPVSVRARVIDTTDRAVVDSALVFQPREFASNRTADCRINLPLSRLSPGEYLLHVEATMGERVAGRALRFRVN